MKVHTVQRWSGRFQPTAYWAKWIVIALCLLWQPLAVMANPLSQTEVQKLLASDVAARDQFGYSVALSGDRALIGAPTDFFGGVGVGSAFMYERDGAGVWVEVAKLSPSDVTEGTRFGRSVALSGDRALVGADGGSFDGNGESRRGSAYVFERDSAGTWVEVAKLTVSAATVPDRFGNSVALLGDRALVGAITKTDTGMAYVYERNNAGVWQEVAELTPSNATQGARFGTSVALSGDRALVGASSDDNDGSAYVYELDRTGAWVETAKLTASDGASRDFFGGSVSLSGDRALVGANGDDTDSDDNGSAYMYERVSAGVWVEAAKLKPAGNTRRAAFGFSVDLSDDRALIGAFGFSTTAGNFIGAAYIFERDSAGTWVETTKLNASDASPGDRFGVSVALSEDQALVGTFSAGSISAYVFDVPELLDTDNDGIVDPVDNCPSNFNPLQENFDGDVLGNVCDLDDDNDGVDDDSDPFPLNPNRPGGGGLPSLILETVDSTQYGFRVEGINSNSQVLERQFDASGSDLLLTLTGFDIDIRREVRVAVNGTEIGFLSQTPNNGRGPSELMIARGLLKSAGNTLRFEQLNPGWTWGVSDLLLSKIGSERPSLVLDSVDSGQYGFRFEGVNSNRTFLERQFDASGSDLLLTLTGYDIDTRQEVRVLVNGTEIGFLSRTPNNGRSASRLMIDQSLLKSTGNILRFKQVNPGWIWGVTDLLLSEDGGR